MKEIPKFNYFCRDVADKYGVDEAVMHMHLSFWIAKNRLDCKNSIEAIPGHITLYENLKCCLLYRISD